MNKLAHRHGRVAALDGLRGIAAFAVLLHHSQNFIVDFPYGFLAVDFFYVLSGYVIGIAYEQSLLGKLRVADYFVIRLERLYPMIFLGALLGLLSVPVIPPDGYFVPKENYSLPVAFIAQLLLIPCAVAPGMFFINKPLWSIFFELAVNLLHATFLPWLRNRVIAAILVLSAGLLCWIGISYGNINYGWGLDNLLLGIPRVLFGFFAGLLLYRTKNSWILRLPSIPFWILGLVLLLLLGMPEIAVPGALSLCLQLGSVLIVFPLIVALGAKATSGGSIGRVLGALSYPLYAIHQPLLFIEYYALKVSGIAESEFAQVAQVVSATLILALAYAAGHFIDDPWNRWRKNARQANPWFPKLHRARGQNRAAIAFYPYFGPIKILAALAVAFSSAVLVATGSDQDDPLRATGYATGVYGVFVLAIIAGFFAAESAWRADDALDFLRKRLWRVYPAFVISTLLIAYVICPLFAVGGPAAFIRDSSVLDQVSQVIFLHTDKFYFSNISFYPHLGTDDYLPGIANSVVWTIPILVFCYLIVTTLKAFGLFDKDQPTHAMLTVVWIAGLSIVYYHWATPHWVNLLLFVLPSFCCGVFANGLVRHHHLRGWIAALSVAVLVAATVWGALPDLFCYFATYPIVWIGMRRASVSAKPKFVPDITYGIYLFGWPVAQLVRALLGPGWSGYVAAVVVLPIAVAFGYLTWLFLERPIARWRAKLAARESKKSPPIGKAKKWTRPQSQVTSDRMTS